jgi:hypothetical protein
VTKRYRRRSFRITHSHPIYNDQGEATIWRAREELEIMYNRNQEECPTRLIIRQPSEYGMPKTVAGFCLTTENREKLRTALEITDAERAYEGAS